MSAVLPGAVDLLTAVVAKGAVSTWGPIHAIPALLRTVMLHQQGNAHLLTPAHAALVYCCNKAKCYHITRMMCSKPWYEVARGVTSRQYLETLYFAAVAYIAVKEFKSALHFLRLVRRLGCASMHVRHVAERGCTLYAGVDGSFYGSECNSALRLPEIRTRIADRIGRGAILIAMDTFRLAAHSGDFWCMLYWLHTGCRVAWKADTDLRDSSGE